MKKFVLIHYGFETPTHEIMKAWNEWFESIGDAIVENVGPFMAGREITKDGSQELPRDLTAITGFTIIQADNMDEAAKIAQGCPSITSIRVYELMQM